MLAWRGVESLHSIGWLLLPILSALVLVHASWTRGLVGHAHAHMDSNILKFDSSSAPIDPMDLADDSWGNFQRTFSLLLAWAAVHLAGQAMLRKALRPACGDAEGQEESLLRKQLRAYAAWSLTCTLAMLYVMFGFRHLMLPLAWALFNIVVAHGLPLQRQDRHDYLASDGADGERAEYGACNGAVEQSTDPGRPAPAQSGHPGQSTSVEDRPAPRNLVWLPMVFNIGIFAAFGAYANAHYGLATFFFMLRGISYCADVLDVRQGGARAGLGAELEDLSLGLDFFFYPPLYAVGPVMCYAEFARARRDAAWKTAAGCSAVDVSRATLAWAATFWLFGAVRRVLYPTGIAKFLLDQGGDVSLSLLFSLAYWFTFFAWFRWMISWRFFRIWANADNMPAAENVRFCIASCDAVRGLWRDWHVSFYAWMQRYIYFPLGGSRVAWAPLNVIAVFFFVFFVHDPEMKRIDSYGVVFGFFALALLVEVAMSRLKTSAAVGFGSFLMVAEPCVSAVLLYGPGLLVFMSMTGVNGWAQTLQIMKRVPLHPGLILEASVLLWLAISSVCAARAARKRPIEEAAGAIGPCEQGSWMWLRSLSVPLVVGIAAAMAWCYSFSNWHWERFEPYLTPEQGKQGVIRPAVGPYYSSCEAVQLNAFVRAPMNAGSSVFALMTPAYLLWHAPAEAPYLFAKLSQLEGGEVMGAFLRASFFFTLLCHLGLVFTSWFWHSSITQQMHYLDICMVLAIAINELTLLSGLLLLPADVASMAKNTESEVAGWPGTKTGRRAMSNTSGLAVLTSALPFLIVSISLGDWVNSFAIAMPCLVLTQPVCMLLLARREANTCPSSKNYFLLSAALSVAAMVLKAVDEKQEWLRAEMFCSPHSLIQFTALMHTCYGIASYFSIVATHHLLLERFGIERRGLKWAYSS
eukprot:gb/GFBE01037255.1/.p1 GENE.gb/GFBE01037255.1/~~gb/GFBE01037255.1/.p1  ORF type:complete len:919 (+),score=161.05 gb/GFBE01037255.1/:1-2757(+)